LIGRTDLCEDERFATNPARVDNRNQLIPILQRIFLERPREAWITALLDMNIPAGPINDVAQALTDPHVIARGLIQQTTLANDLPIQFVGSPLNLSETPPQVRYPPPALGQHTDEILGEILQMDSKTIADLRQHDVL
jgi:formyl-CoA transferase